MALIVKNNVSGELASGITDVATSVTLTDATDFPDPGADYYFATISTTDESDWEIVKVTAKASNTLTIERAQESAADSRLAARAWSAGDKIELRLTAGMFENANTPYEYIQVACSDLTSDLETGAAKAYFRMPFAGTLVDVRASVLTAPTGSGITADINEAGTSVLSTKLTIDATEKTSETAATAAVISDAALADDAEITIDIDAVGSTVAGAGLIVTLVVRRA
jgi:hypothetical protein